MTVITGIITRALSGLLAINITISGLDGYAGYLMVAALFLALPHTFFTAGHIRVSFLLHRTQGRVRRFIEYLSELIAAIFSTYFSWFAIRLVWQSYEFGDIATTADALPLWKPQAFMALGCIGLTIACWHIFLRGKPWNW